MSADLSVMSAEELVQEMAEFAVRAGSVWIGAVELTPEECRAELASLVADAREIMRAEYPEQYR